jgi:NAD+ kinase
MKAIGVIANCGKPQARAVLARVQLKAAELGLRLYTDDAAAARLLPGARLVASARLAARVDALLALGGDGTMLHAARLVQATGTPILGVNLGNLGFLTSSTSDELERGLEAVAAGTFRLSERSAAEGTAWRGRRRLGTFRALNDIVVGWGQSSRIITLDVAVNGEHIASYRCDGLIVSTPTGSTGHSLSAGGPIIHPDARAFLINVICPHTLSARPLVLPDRCVVELAVTASTKKLLLSVDGQEELTLSQGDRLVIRRSPHNVRFIRLPGYSYFSVLRHKLQWSEGSRP